MSIRPKKSLSFLRASGLAVLVAFVLAFGAGGYLQAGDILRGGNAVNSAKRNATARSKAGEAAAAQASANAKDRLARTTKAIQAVRNLQQSAGALRTVPDGMVPGGLVVATGANANWAGAGAPTQNGGTVTIQQTQSQAMLHWETFNVGRNTTVRFDQSAGGSDSSKWIAFNKIFDPSGAPSQILGSIKAEGQVYVLNQNGIIFGAGSQVNARALVASSLPINDNLIGQGLLNNPDLQFLFSGLAIPAGNSSPAFTPPPILTADGRIGNVLVERGARIQATANAENTGGRIMLVAPNVTNEGSLEAPSGQVILAAGLQVATTASTDTSLRGLNVHIGSIGTYGGVAQNTGIIETMRGSVIMAGKEVQQFGAIDSTTSVSLNGRIDLLASYGAAPNPQFLQDPTSTTLKPFLSAATGLVRFGPESVTRILPEVDSAEKAVGSALALKSEVNVIGNTIHLGANSTILAPNAKISLGAGVWHETLPSLVYSSGQIYLEPGALIDASGTTDVFASIIQNILKVQLRGSELANSPLQRNANLRAIELIIDARKKGTYGDFDWIGTPLGDAKGFLDILERSVGQLTAAGGSVQLQAGNSVVLSKGSTIDVSGGWLKYEGGLVNTTKLLYQGNLVNIDDATPDRLYDGIYSDKSSHTHAKWGVVKTYTRALALAGGHYEEAYLSGADAGDITISASSIRLDGELMGNAVAGPRQMRESAMLSTLAKSGSLSLKFQGQDTTSNHNVTYPAGLQIVFQTNPSQSATPAFSLAASSVSAGNNSQPVYLSSQLLTDSGFGTLTIVNGEGSILVPEEVELAAGEGGGISLSASNITVLGRVVAPGGSLAFTTYNQSPHAVSILVPGVIPAPNAGRGIFTLGPDAVLSAAGLVTDDRDISRNAGIQMFQPHGGSVAIKAYSADLQEGSLIDVSGGVSISANGKRLYGDGGSLSILTGLDPAMDKVEGGTLSLKASLQGYSRATGGALTVRSTLVQIGGGGASAHTLHLEPEFFRQGGFTQFAIEGIGKEISADRYAPGVYVAPGTQINPVAESLLASAFTSGSPRSSILLPVDSRHPASLKLTAIGVKDSSGNLLSRGDLVMGEGSVIRTDPLGSVSLKGDTATVLGSIFAPGGAISVSGGGSYLPIDVTRALPTVHIGRNAVLSAAGTTILAADPYGRRIGRVLGGGSIEVSGNIVAEKRALLDVSGASGVLDVSRSIASAAYSQTVSPSSGLNAALYSLDFVPVRIDSDGGSLTLKGAQLFFSDAELRGMPGGPTALGGKLIVSSGRFDGTSTPSPFNPTLIVTASGNTIPASGGEIGVGRAILGANGAPLPQLGHFSVDKFHQGGFDSLDLGGVVKFSGAVNIVAPGRISVADGQVIYADSVVTLTAPYVRLGSAYTPPVAPADQKPPFMIGTTPVYANLVSGPGSLTVNARLIDIGNLALPDIGRLNLFADGGDIRGYGALGLAGHIAIRASQIYPVTASNFTLTASDYQAGGVTQRGSIAITGSEVSPLPLSAGGTISLYASNIDQGGVVRAPLGRINIGWDGSGTAPTNLISGNAVPVTQRLTLGAGSVTSVSAIDPITGEGVLIPYGLNVDGTSWIDPTGVDITAGGLTQKSINLAAQNLGINAGSLIDIRGGGDLYAYRWVSGQGGTRDILASLTSFAVVPGYLADYAPLAGFNESATKLGGDVGYANANLRAGDKVYLEGSDASPAGVYTLLPARYALLPGAVLVTPKQSASVGTLALPDGSRIVSGYRFNSLNTSRDVPTLATRFEVASAGVIASRAQYFAYTANEFLLEGAQAVESVVPRLPVDAGQLVLQASQSMSLLGKVLAQAGSTKGRAGLIDIASPVDILIAGSGVSGGPGVLTLDAGQLSSFGAGSLLIGGIRKTGEDGTSVTVTTTNITVDNAGTALTAADLILAARKNLILADGAEIASSGDLAGGTETLYFGTPSSTPGAAPTGTGNGALLRVSSDPAARIVRQDVKADSNPLTRPNMVIGAGATLSGGSLIIDSTSATSIDPTANLLAGAISLHSGQISILLDNAGTIQPTIGLVLSGGALQDLQSTSALNLLSYSSIDIYGSGQFHAAGDLGLHAAEIRGFNAGTVMFSAGGDLLLDNSPNVAALGPVAGLGGALEFDAERIRIGANALNVSQYAQLNLNAPGGIILEGSGSLSTQGALTATTSLLTAGKAADQKLTAGGALVLQAPGGGALASVTGGLGAKLALKGQSINAASSIWLPSGSLTLHATSGDVVVSGLLDVSGTQQKFFDTLRYTDAGQINLIADAGDVNVQSGSILNVSAQAGGGNAGTLSVTTPSGEIILDGDLRAQAGAGGLAGNFKLDVGELSDFGILANKLNDSSFSQSRSFRVRDGNVLIDGYSKVRHFDMATDNGSITVVGTIDASGRTGGSIDLAARGDLTLQAGSLLTVVGDTFSSAGKGGEITLEAGSQRNGVAGTGSVDIQTGSTLDLRVLSKVAGGETTVGSSAYFGQFSGKLHIRAPQNAAHNDLLVKPINGSIIGASSLLVEGYRVYDLTGTSGEITAALQAAIKADGETFLGTAGSTAKSSAIRNRLLGGNADYANLSSILVLAPGAEIIRRDGDITLGTATSTTTSDWNLSTYRFGEKQAPGVLTIRASGNLVFNNALSDGFAPTLASSNTDWLFLARLATQNTALPTNTQSWSYRLVAGADVNSAGYGNVLPTDSLGQAAGYLKLGKNNGNNSSSTPGLNATTSQAVANRFQVIRTGSGDIDIRTGRSVQLLNQFATIYTAGTRVVDPRLGLSLDIPSLTQEGANQVLGANQQLYPVLFSMAGGNVSILAQENIEHLTRNQAGELVADSSRQLPNNWLYRRGYVDPLTGEFAQGRSGIASTMWWVDFSNFFEGVGALGGGDVTMIAGKNISNVDAVIPTSGRMAKGVPNAANLLELGGGDLTVRAGANVDAGVYYVERGHGILSAGQDIVTNSTRSPTTTNLTSANIIADPLTWLPTTLFLGKGGFDVSAGGDLLLGPVGNVFLMPQGINNTYYYKTYFSTYASDSYVNVSSLGGSLTLREGAYLSGDGALSPLLQIWARRQQLLTRFLSSSNPGSASWYQPWLRLSENNVDGFGTIAGLMPATLRATAFSGDINVAGNITLSPSATGTLDLLAGGAVNGFQPVGSELLQSGLTTYWASSKIVVSDANPASIPGVATPLAYQRQVGTSDGEMMDSSSLKLLLASVDSLFQETGSTRSVLSVKQALHGPGPLHLNDADPLRVYSVDGSISGLSLFSPKFSRIFAGLDISDVALYLQNLDEDDVSIVSSGRDILPYNENTLQRVSSRTLGNLAKSLPNAGDIQISGPGALEVLAGRNLDLGSAFKNSDGTGSGIASIGNARNPYLPFEGADLVVGAGIGFAAGLSDGTLDMDSFISQFLDSDSPYLTELIEEFGGGSLESLSPENRARLALKAFYLVLRDAGRGYAAGGSASYAQGFEAISQIFGTSANGGDIQLHARDIRTTSGGDIDIFAPGGQISLAPTLPEEAKNAPPGIVTEYGGRVSLFADGDINIGLARIFTLRGGDMILWSSNGNIAAGSAPKTVRSAPPTRVLVDPQSADVQTDLAGLATGGGIGVLATVQGVEPGDVDLIAPNGIVDAGDAGIRVSGNLNIAAVQVLNADNINVTGASFGVPSAPVVFTPNTAGLSAASNTAGAATTAANEVAQQVRNQAPVDEALSLITAEVLGYGGGEADEEDEEREKESEQL